MERIIFSVSKRKNDFIKEAKKMKKRLTLVILAVAMLAAAGCSTPRQQIYDVATRTESDSEVSLSVNQSGKSRYRTMYEEACADGYAESYTEFLKEIGASDDAFGVNEALLSAVSVYAGFRSGSRQTEGVTVIGSGVIYSLNREKGDAYVLTNHHIMYNSAATGKEEIPYISDSVTLYLYGGETASGAIEAEYVGGSMDYDIAVLKVENSEVLKKSAARAAEWGDSDALGVGERVYAVGNADGRGISAVGGILSVSAEYINIPFTRVTDGVAVSHTVSMLEMRTDAPVNHGNSGGGLFNAEGQLVGIVNARSEKSGVEQFGYALPWNLVHAVVQNILDNSKANTSRGALRATLGVTVQVTGSTAEYDETTGRARIVETVEVVEAERGSLSDGKLRAGDVICSVRINDGEEAPVTRLHMLGASMFRVRRGDTVTVSVLRKGQQAEAVFEFTSNNDFTLFD